MTAHFEVVRAPEPGPVVVEVPHAGLRIDEAAARFTAVPADALAAGALSADADLGADAVWEGSEAHGVSRIVARAHRYVIDLNTEPRLPSPDEEKLPDPLRAILVRSACGVSFRQPPLPRAEIERRIRELFEPYHAAVAAELERARARYAGALLVSSHSYLGGPQAADVVIGTLHGAAASLPVRDRLAAGLRAEGFSVALEDPFAGGYSIARHGRPDARVHAVQIELHKRLVCRGRVVDARAAARVGSVLLRLLGEKAHTNLGLPR